VNYLLDTHVLLWLLGDPGQLSAAAREAIQNPRNQVFVSAVSAVEISIKKALGKLDAPEGLTEEIVLRGLQHLPFEFPHGEALAELPPHHADPFDRMLICQALHERLTLITRDRKMEPYSVKLLWT
jgi:PIN domain nuclease of toxin-antitoxin system